MERKIQTAYRTGAELLLAIMVVVVAVFMLIVVYGVDTIVPGVHDLFHDFRHSLGISCH